MSNNSKLLKKVSIIVKRDLTKRNHLIIPKVSLEGKGISKIVNWTGT